MTRTWTTSLLSLCAAAVLTSGCTYFRPGAGDFESATDLALAQHPQAAPQAEPGAAAPQEAVVTIRPELGRTRQHRLEVTAGLTLQEVLEQYKLTRRFNNMKINVMRVTPYSKGQVVPLVAEYDTAKNCVGILHDITILPGDHVLIVEDTTRPLDTIMDAVLGGSRR